jgi:hypothetical protein
MKKLIYAVLVMFSIVAVITSMGSCKKYPNDKGIMLKKPEKRLEGTWTWDSNSSISWTFNDDGSGKRVSGGTFPFTWTLNSDKTHIQITWNGTTIEREILQLSDGTLESPLESEVNRTFTKQ